MSEHPHHDVIIVGAGFAGLYTLYKLKQAGFDAIAIERGDDVGGVWHWNRYPGARCDLESLQYSYCFDPDFYRDWNWTERFATQPEIHSYLSHVADRYGLRDNIRLSTSVTGARWSSADRVWTVETDKGAALTARFFVMAGGALSTSKLPDIAGIDDFEGEILRTAQWPAGGVDLSGKRVGVIGTGSSGVQAIPLLAREAERLTVFQRTPSFCVPARNGPLSAERISSFKDDPIAMRSAARQTNVGMLYDYGPQPAHEVAPAEREAELERRWQAGGTNFLYAFNDVIRNEAANEIVADFVRRKIAQIVVDPAVAERLTPRTYPIGAKRVCVGTDYYETYNRPNVELVDIRATPIKRLTRTGIETSEKSYDLDCIVFATGFDAVSGSLLAFDISADGEALKSHWANGPRSFLGLTVAGFPNMFVITGPGSPSVISNNVVSIEHDADWIADCLTWLRANGVDRIEAPKSAEDDWQERVNQSAENTLFLKADSWYVGANIPGKPRQIMPYLGGLQNYIESCRLAAADGYGAFDLQAARHEDAGA